MIGVLKLLISLSLSLSLWVGKEAKSVMSIIFLQQILNDKLLLVKFKFTIEITKSLLNRAYFASPWLLYSIFYVYDEI